MKRYTFGKAERLKSRKRIDQLFASRKSCVAFPLRVKYGFGPATETSTPVQAGVSVSKKHFKRAVDRNRLKRLMREAYRLQKSAMIDLMQNQKATAALFFIYTGSTVASFDIIKTAMAACLQQLHQKARAPHENLS